MPANDTFAPPDAGARYAERRLVRRYSLFASAEVLEPIARARVAARTAHISMNGCFIEMPNPFPLNTVIQIRVRRDDETFETWGRVASVRPQLANETAGIGVAFFQAESDQEKVLAGWIERLQSAELASK